MKILVTGGAGYVGTTLVPLLLKRGYSVTVLDSLLFGGDGLLPFFRLERFGFIRGDIRDRAMVQEAVKGHDLIIHLAAIVGYPACRKNPREATEANVTGTRNIMDATSSSQPVIFASTGSNYGAVEELCTEDTPLNPLSLYGQTKTIAERMVLGRAKGVALRFATAFGVAPRLRLDLLINDFSYRALTQQYLVVYESHFKRTFIHVHDMARSFLLAIDNMDKMQGQVYNVGDERLNASKREVCELIGKHTTCYSHYADVGEDADKRNYEVSYKKIHSLGFEATISIEDGIRELITALPAISYRTPYTNS